MSAHVTKALSSRNARNTCTRKKEFEIIYFVVILSMICEVLNIFTVINNTMPLKNYLKELPW